MTTRQYLRKVSLIVGPDSGDALDLSEFRIRFSVRRGDYQTPNTADIRVYNLSDSTANRVAKEFSRVVLQAGYEGNYGIIFDGTVIQSLQGRESPTDTYLDIRAADGDQAYNFAVVNVSLAAGATPKDQIQAVLRAMQPHGVMEGYIPELDGNPLSRGVVLYGMARDVLRTIAKNTQTAWSIQDGKLNFVPLSAYMPGDIPVITSETGMVGMPEQTQNGIKLKMLLNPSIKVGTLIQINNASIQGYRYDLSNTKGAFASNAQAATSSKLNSTDDYRSGSKTPQADMRKHDGYYYVMVANHAGDTRGNDYYTDVICLGVDATMTENIAQSRGVSLPGPSPVKIFG